MSMTIGRKASAATAVLAGVLLTAQPVGAHTAGGCSHEHTGNLSTCSSSNQRCDAGRCKQSSRKCFCSTTVAMSSVEQADFHFSGCSSSGSTYVKTKTFNGQILDVVLVRKKFTGKANITPTWKTSGSTLIVRTTFWGTHGLCGSVSLTFKVIVGPSPDLGPGIRTEVHALELSGQPGQSVDEVVGDAGGFIAEMALVGTVGDAFESVELVSLGARSFAVTAEMAGKGRRKVGGTVFVETTVRDDIDAVDVVVAEPGDPGRWPPNGLGECHYVHDNCNGHPDLTNVAWRVCCDDNPGVRWESNASGHCYTCNP